MNFVSLNREALVATKSIDLGGSPTSRKARREQEPQPVVNGCVG